MATRGDRLRARAARSDKNRAVFNAAKKVNSRGPASFLTRNSLANRKVNAQFRGTLFGRLRKGNLGGKSQAVAGALAGSTKYVFTQARKAALEKARKARR